ncbi:MAG TPA: helix-turn-helix transcriptional regulator [Propionibacteriaceae bacterium]|nr:helix-turn-helix transcriptional regulator [Propionibacteriaceae bacterium]
MDRQAVHDFLASRRARITPEQVGMPTYGEKRRVPGLRREEVASLAGVSFDYYARLERGNLSGSRTRFWTPWPGLCSWMRQSGSICSTLPRHRSQLHGRVRPSRR